jgi:hypothetical protein
MILNTIYRLLLAFNSTYMVIVVFLIQQRYIITKLNFLSIYVSYILFILTPVLLTYLSFKVMKYLDNDEIKKVHIKEIELANNSFLPSYLGYFFVALGIVDVDTLLIVFFILFIFTFLSQTLYFNPIFLLFGYHFYFLKNINDVKIFLISKKQLKKPNDVDFNQLKRINNYTFIDLENN